MLKNFRTFQLANQFYQEAQKISLPLYLKDQLDRSSSSIALNLAEGYGKATYKDQRKFFSIAMGSLRESQAILILAQIDGGNLVDLADHLAASIYKLIKAHPRP